MNVMGGSEIWRFNASLSYDETVGVMKGSDRANFNGSLGITYQGEKLIVSENLSVGTNNNANRSEERRVGKECRSRWSPYH